MSMMVQHNRLYPSNDALAALGLPSGSESSMEVGVQRRNMADSLFKAVAGCRIGRVKFMLTNGVSTNVLNDRGQNLLVTALHIDDDDKRDKMFRFLLKKDVDCCRVDTPTGRDVMAWACLLGRHVEVSRLMEAAMGEIDYTRTDKQGMTGLHHATIQGHLSVVGQLVGIMDKYRLSVDVTDAHGLTPFIYAKRLGYFNIAEVLIREGRCSTNQFDSSVHKSVEDWTRIGLRERHSFARRQQKELLAQYKIRGRIPGRTLGRREHGSHLQLPAITLSDCGMESTGSTESMTLLVGEDGGRNGAVVASQQMAGKDQHRPVDSVHGGELSLPPLSQQRLMSPGRILHDNSLNKSMDTAFALLGVQANQSSEIVHASQFVHSQLDTTKSGAMGDITSMMDILADQQTDSFRTVAKAPTPPPVRTPPVPKKRNISTLAILFGKDNSTRRYKPAARGSSRQKGKTLSQHAKSKKRKTTAKHKTK